MCIADMVETIVNDWMAANWDDIEGAAARDFPTPSGGEVGYATHLAKDLCLDEGEHLLSLEIIEQPIEKELNLPPVTLRPSSSNEPRRKRTAH